MSGDGLDAGLRSTLAPRRPSHYTCALEMVLEVLLTLGLLVVVAKLAEGVFSRFGLSSIIAYTATGVVLGPVLGIAEATPEIQLFLGIGILVLFFLVGLDEIDIPGFVATFCGRYFVAAVLSVLVSLLAALIVTSDLLNLRFALGLDFTEALALAGILSLSSLGLLAKVLADDGHLKEPIGLKMFTIVTIAEVFALLVVGFSIGDHHGQGGHDLSALNVLILLAQIAGFVVVTWVLSAKLLPPAILFLRRFIRVPELSFGLLLGGLFLVVVGAEKIGLHGTIGALLFGAALSGLPEGVRHDILPGMRSASEGLFVPLFFASAGLQFDLSFTEIPIGTIAALVLVPLVGKFAGSFLSTIVTRIESPFTLATGLMSKGVAEIALLLVLLEAGVIEQSVFSLFVLVMFGYILLMPQAIKISVKRAKSEYARMPQVIPPSYVRYALSGVKIGSLLDRSRSYPGSATTVQSFLDDWIVPNHRDYVVVDGGEVAGIVSMSKVRSVPGNARATTTLRDLLRVRTPHAGPDELIVDVMDRMTSTSITVIPVMDGDSGLFLGTLASHDVMDLVALMEEIKEEEKSMGAAVETADA